MPLSMCLVRRIVKTSSTACTNPRLNPKHGHNRRLALAFCCVHQKCSQYLESQSVPTSLKGYGNQSTQCSENIMFLVSKANKKAKIVRFLKLFDEFSKCLDQEKLVKSVFAAVSEQSAEEILEEYQHEKLQANNIIRARRICIEGCQHGQLVLLKSRIKFYPLLNAPDCQYLESTYSEIKYITRYRYMFQHVGIEMWFFNYPYSVLFVFSDNTTRDHIYKELRQRAQKMVHMKLHDVIEMWTRGEISNVQYLNYINCIGSRSYNDLSQYPVFPWILHRYDTPEFNLDHEDMWRELTKPIGAINKHRLRKLKDFQEMQSKDKTSSQPTHLYPTHYSTPGYVSYFLIRKIPEFIVRLQNGVFSPSDRIFRCVESAYSTSMTAAADFKELIPQFYSNECDFLVNSEKLEMGSTPDGETIDDVVLPKWASNAQDFLLKMRVAFESNYVSSQLHSWIDLIFGYKQLGAAAATADNVFYYLTYQHNVNFDRPMAKVQQSSLEVQVAEFGQTPLQIFQDPHPSRKSRLISLLANPSLQQQVNIPGYLKSEEQGLLHARLGALVAENGRLRQENEAQKNLLKRKIDEKQAELQRYQSDRQKERARIKEQLQIGPKALENFEFKTSFPNQQNHQSYISQLQQLVRQRGRQNQELNVVIVGLKRLLTDGQDDQGSQYGGTHGVAGVEGFFVDRE